MIRFAMNACMLYVTTPDREVAEAIAHLVVEQRLAACANVLGEVQSFYRWEGKVQSDPEVVVLVKTTSELRDQATRAIVERHPYEVPCVLSFDAATGHPPFLQWLAESVLGSSGG